MRDGGAGGTRPLCFWSWLAGLAATYAGGDGVPGGRGAFCGLVVSAARGQCSESRPLEPSRTGRCRVLGSRRSWSIPRTLRTFTSLPAGASSAARTAAGVGPAERRSTPASTRWRSIRSGPRSSTPAPEPACSRASTPGEAGHRSGLGKTPRQPGGCRGEGNVFSLVVDPTDSSVVYAVAGLARGHVSKSADGGRTWRTLPASPEIYLHALTIDPANPQILFAAVEGAWTDGKGHSTIAMTSDGGATWRTVLSHDGNLWAIAVDPASPANGLRRGHRRCAREH